jgi:hypothetical protein
MHTPINPEVFRQRARAAIRQKFKDVLDEAKSTRSVHATAQKIGVSHTMLPFYVKAVEKEGKEKFNVPSADVLLAAVLEWGWTIRVERTGGTPCWCVFGVIDMEGGVGQKRSESAQMSLFDALSELDEQIGSLKKTVGRAEVEVQRALAHRRSA